MGYDATLRKEFHERFENVVWTEELEPNLLSDRKALDSRLFSNRSLSTPGAASVVAVPESEKVYPSITNFGSINIAGIPAALQSILNDFCSSLLQVSRGKTAAEVYAAVLPYIKASRGYMLSVYLYDTAAFPPANEFILGSPAVKDGAHEIPVLFLCQQGSWIVIFYASMEDDGWKIDQIRYGEFVYE